MISDELDDQIKSLLPKIDWSEMDIWSVDYVPEGIEDFTDSSNRMKMRVRLLSKDCRIEILVHLNPKKIKW